MKCDRRAARPTILLTAFFFACGPNPVDHAESLLQSGNLRGGERILRETLASDPGNAGARVLLAGLLLRDESSQEALRELELAIDSEPNHPQALNNLGNLLISLGSPEAALPHLERAAELVEDDPEQRALRALIAVNLAGAHAGAGHTAEAMQAWSRALELNSGNTQVLSQAGRFALRNERWPQAARIFQLLAAREPNQPDHPRNLARAQLGAGLEGEARANLENLVAQHPRDADALYLLARLSYTSGASEEARTYLDRILAIDASHEDARTLQMFITPARIVLR